MIHPAMLVLALLSVRPPAEAVAVHGELLVRCRADDPACLDVRQFTVEREACLFVEIGGIAPRGYRACRTAGTVSVSWAADGATLDLTLPPPDPNHGAVCRALSSVGGWTSLGPVGPGPIAIKTSPRWRVRAFSVPCQPLPRRESAPASEHARRVGSRL